jgi:hypothetical protein
MSLFLICLNTFGAIDGLGEFLPGPLTALSVFISLHCGFVTLCIRLARILSIDSPLAGRGVHSVLKRVA